MSNSVINPPDQKIGGVTQVYQWNYQSKTIRVIFESLGNGEVILLLPAFSTVSSRSEMASLAQKLSDKYRVITLDWPGFGDSDRPWLDYDPLLYDQFLSDFVKDNFSQPIKVIGAGHGAGIILKLAHNQPSSWSKIVLCAPTWSGPLPTAIGPKPIIYKLIRILIQSRIIGQLIYKLVITKNFIAKQLKTHVYADPQKLTPELIEQKYHTTTKAGARYTSAAFVTGGLDLVQSRSEFLELFTGLSIPILVVIGNETPSKSRAEMDACSSKDGIQKAVVPGSLILHEESATELAPIIEEFLK